MGTDYKSAPAKITNPREHDFLTGTSKNPSRHAELVTASHRYQEIADQVRNDGCVLM